MKTLVAIACFALAGCAGPKPPVPLAALAAPPGDWRDTSGSPTEVASDWWRAYGDPVLDRYLDRVADANVDIAIAAARVEEARALAGLASANRLPAVDFRGGGARQRDVSPFGEPREQSLAQAQIALSYDLDLFGRLEHADAAARADLLASEAAQRNIRLAARSTFVTGYFNLLGLDARLAVLRETASARAKGRDLAKRRADAGYAPMLEARQAEADYKSAAALIPATELAIRRQENALSILLGRDPGPIDRGTTLMTVAVPGIRPSYPADVVRQRPDILQAEQQVVAADRRLDAARAAFMPSIRLEANGGAVASTLLGDPISIFTLGGSILAPLFDGGRLAAQRDGAAARRDQAAFGYRRAVLTAFREVEDAMTAAIKTSEQERELVGQRSALDESLRLATNRYQAGYSPYFEQLDAQRALLGAELALIQARIDRLNATVTLYQALGGGEGPADHPKV